MDKSLNYLALARKAGRVELGEEPVGAAARAQIAYLVVVAKDAGDHTWRRAKSFVAGTQQMCIRLPYTKDDLGASIGRTALAMAAFTDQFDPEYHRYVSQINSLVRQAVSMSQDLNMLPMNALERLQCKTGAQVLAGAVYALLAGGGDFDASVIIAVNHSGASAAVGALVGAVLGARLGEEALPEFYLECLECRDILQELADDLCQGCPIESGDVFFDDDWDGKYCHGRR